MIFSATFKPYALCAHGWNKRNILFIFVCSEKQQRQAEKWMNERSMDESRASEVMTTNNRFPYKKEQ